MRRLAVLAIACALPACGGERTVPAGDESHDLDPVATLQAFYDALAADDVDAAVAWMLPPSDPDLAEALAEELGETVEHARTGVLVLEAKEAQVEDPWALVVARHTLATEDGALAQTHGEMLYRTDAGWRVVSERARSDPAVEPLWDEHAEALWTSYRASRPSESRYHSAR